MSRLEKEKELYGYTSPNVETVQKRGQLVVFKTKRIDGKQEVTGETIFNEKGKVIEVSSYEKQYLTKEV